jgi:hypothetical protein
MSDDSPHGPLSFDNRKLVLFCSPQVTLSLIASRSTEGLCRVPVCSNLVTDYNLYTLQNFLFKPAYQHIGVIVAPRRHRATRKISRFRRAHFPTHESRHYQRHQPGVVERGDGEVRGYRPGLHKRLADINA